MITGEMRSLQLQPPARIIAVTEDKLDSMQSRATERGLDTQLVLLSFHLALLDFQAVVDGEHDVGERNFVAVTHERRNAGPLANHW